MERVTAAATLSGVSVPLVRFSSLLLLLCGCWSTAISAKDYDQTCSAASDCVLVTDGNACAVCTCPNAAVNAKARAQFNSDQNAIACVHLGPGVRCGVCDTAVVACTDGKCGITR